MPISLDLLGPAPSSSLGRPKTSGDVDKEELFREGPRWWEAWNLSSICPRVNWRRHCQHDSVFEDSNGCQMEHARDMLYRPKGRSRFIKKPVIMQCKENFLFCDDDDEIIILLTHIYGTIAWCQSLRFACLISLNNHNVPVDWVLFLSHLQERNQRS